MLNVCISDRRLLLMQTFMLEYNNLGTDLNYEIYDSLSSAKERFNELVNSRLYDMVLLYKKALENKSPKYDRVISQWDGSDIYRWDSPED
jgi:hypothetical protein